jgi:hypothetical protein
MANYAFIDTDNLVVEVITGKDEDDLETLPNDFTSWEEYYETKREGLTCLRTSFNTDANKHLDGKTPFRGNYAGIGMSYDSANDVFIKEKEFDSWVMDEATWSWVAPVDKPNDDNLYGWNEESLAWEVVPPASGEE